MTENMYPRGSEWKRWDLHIHSPSSYLANEFGDPGKESVWENYSKNLFQKALDNKIVAIGITDYFSIEGYERILAYQKDSAKLKSSALGFSDNDIEEIQTILLLPNIELRLKCFAGNHNRVNFHVIFSSEVETSDIKENFLESLEFVYEGNPTNHDYKNKLTKSNLERLGKKLKDEQHEFADKSNLYVGGMNAVIDDTQLMDILSKNSRFKNKYLVCIPVDEDLSNLEWSGQDHLTRKVLYQKSSCFFTSNTGTIEFGLGKKHTSTEEFLKEFVSIKPCIHGSDAHSIDKMFSPDKNRFCWIKAEPTFAGLRQILFDPEERVYIGEMPPSEIKNPADTITQIHLEEFKDWFTNNDLSFNKGLVSIIGQKGSGKTALADLIAYCMGTWDKLDSDRYSNSFLQKAIGKLYGARLTVECGNGDKCPSILAKDYIPKKPPAVQYLSQQFVTSLCEDVAAGSLMTEIENVIFTYISEENRLQATNFNELKEKRLVAVQAKRTALATKIQQSNERLIALYQLRDKDITEKTAIKGKNCTELEGLKNSLPKAATDEEKANIDLLSQKNEFLTTERAKVATLNVKLSKLDELESVLTAAESMLSGFRLKVLNNFTELELEPEDLEKIAPVANTAYKEFVSATRAKWTSEKDELTKPDSAYQRLNAEIEELKKKVIEDKSKQAKYQEAVDKIAMLEKQNSLIVASIEKMQKAILDIEAIKSKRIIDFIDLIRTLKEEQLVYLDMYRPLRQRITEGTDTEKLLNFNIRYIIQSDDWKETAKILINKRGKNIFDEENAFNVKLGEYLNVFTSDEFADGENINQETETKLKNIIIELLSIIESSSTMPSFNTGYSITDLYGWLFSIGHIKVSFGIQFENVNLERLSTGTRGIILLLIYLGIDTADTRPLIIDQPEDNLDNTSVYNILVPYFRKAKQRRQIFLITHNANLVINTDSEQIILASMERQSNTYPKISYEIKSLEGGKEKICKILEGGTAAFKMREKKYDL